MRWQLRSAFSSTFSNLFSYPPTFIFSSLYLQCHVCCYCPSPSCFLFSSLLFSFSDELSLLGELQFAFVSFLIGQSYDGFDQWKSLLNLFCSCEKAVQTRPTLFAEFVGKSRRLSLGKASMLFNPHVTLLLTDQGEATFDRSYSIGVYI